MARPRKEEQTDLAARATDAALRLCGERGADRVTMQDIAAALGCRPPALYHHFPNKEALLLVVHDEGFRQLFAAKRAAVADADGPLDRLRRGGWAYVRFAAANPELYELMFNDRGPHRRREEDGGGTAADPARQALAVLEDTVRACQQAGCLTGVPAETAAFTLWSAVHGAIALALRRRSPFPGADGVETMAGAAVDTMVRWAAGTGGTVTFSPAPPPP